jgi:TonB family protein
MSRTWLMTFLASCGVHGVIAWWLWSPSGMTAVKPSRTVEVELRPYRAVEARRVAGPETRQTVTKRRAARTVAPAVPVIPVSISKEGEPAVVPSPEGVPGDEELTGGGGGEADAGVTSGSAAPPPPPPPPPPDTEAAVIALPRFAYPERAREDGVEGVVRLWIRLDARGEVVEIEVREEPGAGLGEAARRAVMRGKFRAATHLGEPVQSSFEYLYRFELL